MLSTIAGSMMSVVGVTFSMIVRGSIHGWRACVKRSKPSLLCAQGKRRQTDGGSARANMKNKTSPIEPRRGRLGARQCRGYTVRCAFAAHLLVAAREGGGNCHRGFGSTRRASRAWNRADPHPRSRPRHGGGRHGRAVEGAGRQGNSLANVRRVRQRHRPRSGADRCPMALRPSSPAGVGTAFHQVRDLRDGHQGHRCAGAAGARRQSGPVRRGGRGQDGVAHRNDPQHDRAPGGRKHFLRHRRTLSRRRGALPRDEGSRRAAEHGDGVRPDERAAGQPVPRGPRGADDGRVFPGRRASRCAAAHRQYLPLSSRPAWKCPA